MKELEISRLMDEYQDNEFFPEGGSTADTQTVKELVLAKAEPKKRRKLSLKTVLLAAALAVVIAAGALFTAGAGEGKREYNLLGSFMSTMYAADGNHETLEVREPVVLEDGRLWYVAEGGREDITDLIDGETPYIRANTDGVIDILIIGGTPEDYGYYEWIWDKSGKTSHSCNAGTTCYLVDGIVYRLDEEWSQEVEEKIADIGSFDTDHAWTEYRPWMLAAAEKIGLDLNDPSDNPDIIYP